MKRVVARLRRGLRWRVDMWRSPRRTGFRRLRVVDHRGAVAWGSSGLALDQQPPDRVRLGTGVRVGDHVAVHLGPEGRVEVGDGAVVGHHVTIASDALVRIGAGSHVGAYAVLTDTWTYGRAPAAGFPPPPEPAPVEVAAGARVGMQAVLGPGTTVAPGAEVPVATTRHTDLEDAP